jgi:hypothetical protein
MSNTLELFVDADLPAGEVRKNVREYGPDAGKVSGVQVVFPNGMTLSIQWHSGAYSSVGRGYEGEPTFETAAWYPEEYGTQPGDFGDTSWYNPHTDAPHKWDDGCDQVQAYQTVAQVVELARKVAAHVLPPPPSVANLGAALALVGAALVECKTPSDVGG